jgi:hypothetical protein
VRRTRASFVLFDAAALARLDRPIRVKGVILTYRYRVRDATTAKRLRAHAVAVNCVWNFCGETQEAARRQEKRWPSAFDLIKLTTGSSSLLGLHSDTVRAVCRQFVVNRDAARRRPHWRGKKNLGWTMGLTGLLRVLEVGGPGFEPLKSAAGWDPDALRKVRPRNALRR